MKRLFITEFYDHRGTIIQTNRATNPNSAAMRMFVALSTNVYGATTAQTYHEETSVIFTEMKRSIKGGKITTTYSYEPSNYDSPVKYKASALFTPEELALLEFVLDQEVKYVSQT